jgi:hypothetical protein
MKTIFANLTRPKFGFWLRSAVPCLLIASIWVAVGYLPESAAEGVLQHIERATDTPTAMSQSQANQLVLRAARQLSMHYSVSAKLRQRVELFGQVLQGTGEFWQLNLGGTSYVRYEVRLPIRDQVAMVQHINDGRFLWMRSSVPTPFEAQKNKTSLRRLDVQAVTKSLEKHYQDNPSLEALSAVAGRGGMAELLLDLHRHFRFHTAYRGNLYGVPVWIMSGTRVSSSPSSAQATAPELGMPQKPDSVTLAIGEDDLFTYRIEFQQRLVDDAQSQLGFGDEEKAKHKTVLLLELYEVTLDGPLDPRSIFAYPADEVQLVDITDAYVRKMLE